MNIELLLICSEMVQSRWPDVPFRYVEGRRHAADAVAGQTTAPSVHRRPRRGTHTNTSENVG
jgi:hypothetical protein